MEALTKFRDYEVEFYNTNCNDRGNKKRLLIFTNGTIDPKVNHRIEIISTDLSYDTQTHMTTKKSNINFCTGSTWDTGPIGMHTEAEFENWMANNPSWTVVIVDN